MSITKSDLNGAQNLFLRIMKWWLGWIMQVKRMAETRRTFFRLAFELPNLAFYIWFCHFWEAFNFFQNCINFSFFHLLTDIHKPALPKSWLLIISGKVASLRHLGTNLCWLCALYITWLEYFEHNIFLIVINYTIWCTYCRKMLVWTRDVEVGNSSHGQACFICFKSVNLTMSVFCSFCFRSPRVEMWNHLNLQNSSTVLEQRKLILTVLMLKRCCNNVLSSLFNDCI